jgi:hypothetical protein
VAQVVEHLSGKCKDLSSNPSAKKKTKKKKQKKTQYQKEKKEKNPPDFLLLITPDVTYVNAYIHTMFLQFLTEAPIIDLQLYKLNY